ncbi:envelope biogenesis factor ElyC [Escherichia coli]
MTQTFIPGKDAALEDSIARFQQKLSDLGFQIEEASWLNPVPNVWSVHIRDKECALCFTNGKGATKKAALASALGEYFERLSTNYFFADFWLGETIANGPFVHYPNEKWFPLTENDDVPEGLLDDRLRAFYDPENELTGSMLIGLALLWFSRFQKTGKIFISIGWLALLLLSLQPVADRLLRPIESTYPTWNNSQKVDYIVVLGGGYTWNPQWAPSSNLINNSLPRLNEGIRLWRENPGSKLIFTGGVAKTNTVSTAEVGARVAQSLGVPREQIITLDLPKDTEEEAAAVKQAIGDAPFLLVTSASHLPRAMIFFQQEGLNPLPAPANQLAIDSPLNPWERAIPSPVWLMHSDRVGYETLGRIWQWLKGSSGEPRQE